MENSVPELRQYSIEEILSITFNIIKKHWLKFLLICLIVYVPLLLAANLLDKNLLMNLVPKEILEQKFSALSAFGGMGAFGSFEDFRSMLSSFIPIYYFSIGIMLFGFLVNFSFAEIVQKCAHGEEPNLKDALMAAIKKYPVGLLTSIIAGILILLLCIPLFIPGIIFSVYWTFFLIAIILRNRWGFDALRYSFYVVRGRWWRVLGYSIVFGIIAWFATLIPSQVGQIFLKNPFVYSIFMLINFTLQSFTLITAAVFFLNLESTSKFLVKRPDSSEINNISQIQ